MFMEALDHAMYEKSKLKVKTRARGEIIGTPVCLDDFITDSERLGYILSVGEHEEDTVYLDEIIEINNYDFIAPPEKFQSLQHQTDQRHLVRRQGFHLSKEGAMRKRYSRKKS